MRYRPTIFARISLAVILPLMLARPAHASIFKGETLDTVADILSWIVLVVAPVVAITVFWLLHILPEKIAERKQHPQAKAIQVLCLLSLPFGGLLWPLAWLWAYTKPVLHKLAYGTDKVPHDHQDIQAQTRSSTIETRDQELTRLRRRLAELESAASGRAVSEGQGV